MTAPAIRALIVDDEPLARARLRQLLARHADMLVVAECDEGGEAVRTIARAHPDVVFLDIEMTETSGMDVAARLAGAPLPAVVFVTAHERYALEAFDVRALDYLLKPFEEERFRATLDRVRAWTAAVRSRRSHEHLVAILRELSDTPVEELERLRAPAMPLRFADLELDPKTREVRRAGEPIELTRTEFSLLELFLLNPRQVLTRSVIFERVWGYDFGFSSNSLDVYIGYLRRKTEAGERPRLIQTVRGVGYALREK